MRSFMKFVLSISLLFGTILTAPAMAAESEYRTLSKHGAWVNQVVYNPDEDGLSCTMSTIGSRGTFFIDVDYNGEYSMYGNVKGATADDNVISVVIYIDGEEWTLTNVKAEALGGELGVVWLIQAPASELYEFHRDMANGQEMWIDMPAENAAPWFSLKGSAESLKSLDDCRRKL